MDSCPVELFVVGGFRNNSTEASLQHSPWNSRGRIGLVSPPVPPAFWSVHWNTTSSVEQLRFGRCWVVRLLDRPAALLVVLLSSLFLSQRDVTLNSRQPRGFLFRPRGPAYCVKFTEKSVQTQGLRRVQSVCVQLTKHFRQHWTQPGRPSRAELNQAIAVQFLFRWVLSK